MNNTNCQTCLRNIGKSYKNYLEHCLRAILYPFVLHVGTDGLVSEELTYWIEKLAVNVASS